MARLRSRSCIIDGEAVACDDNGVASFGLVRHQRANEGIFLYAFDLIELNGDDLRRDPLEVRKATLRSMLAKAGGLRFNEHMGGDGPIVLPPRPPSRGRRSLHRRLPPHSGHSDARLRGDARGRDGGIREELAAGIAQLKPETEVEATSILPTLNGKTARSRRSIVAFTHFAREGRMTVTIGRRELLAALGGAAAAWTLAARAQQQAMRVVSI